MFFNIYDKKQENAKINHRKKENANETQSLKVGKICEKKRN